MNKSRTDELADHFYGGQDLTPQPKRVISLRGALMCLSALLVIAGTIGLIRGLM
jgi:hypothetical protein